ncbi:MAG: PqqD family peptide modification chaperone, partial [Clostridia bacterium]
MIYDLDRPCLATHAVLEDEAIVDRSLNRRIELNSTGMMMLKKMNGQKTVREIAEEIAEHYR